MTGKRKNEFHDLKTEPALKALKKQELVTEYKVLQNKFQEVLKNNKILEAQNKTHLESIVLLEETVNLLEKRTIQKTTAGVQTEIIRCEECEFPADCMNDLIYHMHEFHPLEEKQDKIKCNYCDDMFTFQKDLMLHKKVAHIEKVPFCNNFSKGCRYENECWFRHDTSSRISLQAYDCNFCEKKFQTKFEFMIHKKEEHSSNVQKCQKYLKNNCQYSNKKCWFIHEKNTNDHTNDESDSDYNSTVDKHNAMISKLMKMLEEYNQRIQQLESEIMKK